MAGNLLAILGAGAGPAATLPQKSLDFESGVGNYLWLEDSNFGSFDASKIAVSLWVKRESTGTHYLASQWISSSTSSYRLFFSTDKVAWGVQGGGSTGTIVDSASITDTNWHHILATYDGSLGSENLKMWVDGTRVTSFSTETQTSGNLTNSSNDHGRGSRSDSNFPMDGLLYQCAFFSGTLPSISDVYDSGHPKDVSGLAGLHSLLDPDTSAAADLVLASDWWNPTIVTTSTTIPT